MGSTSPFLIVAIDGGAASGKSSTSRALAARFPLLHVDTGAHYRAITAEMLRQGVSPSDPLAVESALTRLSLGTQVTGSEASLEVNGRIPGTEIRSPEVNASVSHFAALPAVRSTLLQYQRGQADVARRLGFRGLLMEGRDIGSVIFPDADLRFYLHADPEERARRRAEQGQADSITERDRLDSSRKTAPLTISPGAIAIDSTHLSLEQVVFQVSARIAEKLQTGRR
ncbi:MAG: (d)CMP kinase [Opitutaceae bacterium]|nr:(d)CMP kinase [Opitutaceae bacterium]